MIFSPIVSIDYSVDNEALVSTINPKFIYTKDYVIKCGGFFSFSLVRLRFDCNDVKCDDDVKSLPVDVPFFSPDEFVNKIINFYNNTFGGFPIAKMEDRLYTYDLTSVIHYVYRAWDSVDENGDCYVCKGYKFRLDVSYDFDVSCFVCSDLSFVLNNIKRVLGG